MKVYLEKKGVKVFSPRDAIKNAFQNEIIHDDTLWLEMLETRNMTSHVYNEDMAEKIFVLLPSYLSPFKKLADNLSNSALI
ncbi:MAG: nucleotidyltransferase [uncultured bacterium]|nr:MAG: nucleotidyltransferase [uncultured bacterium]